MSRVGKKPIPVPDKVNVAIEGSTITVKGSLGSLVLELPQHLFTLEQEGDALQLTAKGTSKKIPALWGLYRALLANMVLGVSEGFQKHLEIEGVGYRAEMKGNDLVLHVGFSHPVILPVPEGINVQVEKLGITISGADKQLVGQFAADIRGKKKPEPYKGKGIRYRGERVRRKAGKRAVGSAA